MPYCDPLFENSVYLYLQSVAILNNSMFLILAFPLGTCHAKKTLSRDSNSNVLYNQNENIAWCISVGKTRKSLKITNLIRALIHQNNGEMNNM